ANQADAEIIINTNPVGMYTHTEKSPIDLAHFSKLFAVVDVVYTTLRNKFVIVGISTGVIAVGGLDMRIGQAKCAVEIFLDTHIEDTIIQKQYLSLLEERNNLVLIGMSGCGKTTLGKMVAKELGKTFVDIDEEIIKQINMPIADYFSTMGELAFRELEKATVLKFSHQNGLVISTGGGVVKDKSNIDVLKQNGLIFWIKRDASLLESGNGRPLTPNAEATLLLYQQRLPLYTTFAEAICENNTTVQNALEDILQQYTTFLTHS
ncbi:MAG: shikimate kinase, partial [Anaerotignum sp.]